MSDICGVYFIQCIINSKRYVGSSTKCRGRITGHFQCLRKGTHINKYLQYSFNKYGEENFIHGFLEETSKDDKLVREQFWIDELKSSDPEFGYNLTHAVVSQTTSVIRSQLSKDYWASLTEEEREEVSRKRKILWDDPVWRDAREKDLAIKSAKRLKMQEENPDFKEQCLSGFTRSRNNPEKEAARIAKIKATWQKKEVKDAQSARKKILAQDPKYAAEHLERMNRPEVKEALRVAALEQ